METIGKPSTLQAYSPESVPKANSHSFRGSWWILLDEGSVPETFFCVRRVQTAVLADRPQDVIGFIHGPFE